MIRSTALAAALALAGAVARAEIPDDGQRAFDAGDYARAWAIWDEEARRGDPQGMLGLGLLSDLGRATPADPAQALSWYQRAGRAGSASGALNAAVMLDSGRSVPRDAVAAAAWYGEAAARGSHRAEYDLAQLYETGDGVPRNPGLARLWYAAAARGGLGAAATRATAPSGDAATTALEAPAPSAPADAAVLPACAPGACAAALVWAVPPEPEGTAFFVQIEATGEPGETPPPLVEAPLSATLVALPGPGTYRWRVFVADPAARVYRAGPWRGFVLARPGRAAGGSRLAGASTE